MVVTRHGVNVEVMYVGKCGSFCAAYPDGRLVSGILDRMSVGKPKDEKDLYIDEIVGRFKNIYDHQVIRDISNHCYDKLKEKEDE